MIIFTQITQADGFYGFATTGKHNPTTGKVLVVPGEKEWAAREETGRTIPCEQNAIIYSSV